MNNDHVFVLFQMILKHDVELARMKADIPDVTGDAMLQAAATLTLATIIHERNEDERVWREKEEADDDSTTASD